MTRSQRYSTIVRDLALSGPRLLNSTPNKRQEEVKVAKFAPIGERVVVKPTDQEEVTTSSGIILPDTAREKPQEGEVVAVGPRPCD